MKKTGLTAILLTAAFMLCSCGADQTADSKPADSTAAAQTSASSETQTTSTATQTTSAAQTTQSAAAQTTASSASSATAPQTTTAATTTLAAPQFSGALHEENAAWKLSAVGSCAKVGVRIYHAGNNISADLGSFNCDGSEIPLPLSASGEWTIYAIPYAADGTSGSTVILNCTVQANEPEEPDVPDEPDEPDEPVSAWKLLYAGAAERAMKQEMPCSFALIYIDADDAPELIVTYAEGQAGGVLYTVRNDKLVTVHEWEGIRASSVWSYIPKSGKFLTYSSSSAFTVAFGVQKLQANGTMQYIDGCASWDGEYSVNGKTATEKQYQKKEAELTSSYEEIPYISYSELCSELE